MAFISVSSIFFVLLLLPPSLQLVGAVEAEFFSASPHVVDTGQVSTKSLPRMFFFVFVFVFCHFCHMGVTELGQTGTWNFFLGAEAIGQRQCPSLSQWLVLCLAERDIDGEFLVGSDGPPSAPYRPCDTQAK